MTNFSKKILAIIPARGGSKRLPGKNIKSLAGKPLIAYSIEAAKKSKYIHRLIVSTDDEKISTVAKSFGAEVILRPADLAEDASSTPPVLRHAVEYLADTEKYHPDLVLLLQPTSPLRTARHIDEMIEKFMAGNYDSMVSVKFEYVPRFEINERGELAPADRVRVNPKDRKPVILENGALYLADVKLVRQGRILGEKIGYYVMDEQSSVDIDEPFDFFLAEQLILKQINF